jgi:hypothetical protein
VFLRFWQTGVEQFDELRGLDWGWLSLDGAMTKAPLGGGKTGANPTDRVKRGVKRDVKRSLLTEGHGAPPRFVVAGASRHDMKLVRATLEQIVMERPQPSAEEPQGLCLDKGYDYYAVASHSCRIAFRSCGAGAARRGDKLQRCGATRYTTKCGPFWQSSASLRISAPEARKRMRSRRKQAIERDTGWWNAHIRG